MPSLEEVKAFVRLHLKQRAYDYPARDEGLDVVSLGYEPAAFEKTIRAFGDRYDVVEQERVTYNGASRPMLSVGHEVSASSASASSAAVAGCRQT